VVGLVASLVILALLAVAVFHATIGPHAYQETPFDWSRTVMHKLFGSFR
jgi:hypothetical protein